MRWIAGALLALVVRAWTADANLRLEPILETRQGEGIVLMPQSDWAAMARKPVVISTAFLAIASSVWPEGLVPVFAMEGDSGKLRRLPPRGTENTADPLFFALPRTEETNAALIAGTWSCTASNSNGSTHYLTWQLTCDVSAVAGRFDPATEYRVAFVSGGEFASNRFRLDVEYSNDRYKLEGRRKGGVLVGTYSQHDGPETGTWVATRERAPAPPPSSKQAVPLFEWTHRQTGHKRYLPELNSPGDEWQRSEGPLCRVWSGP